MKKFFFQLIVVSLFFLSIAGCTHQDSKMKNSENQNSAIPRELVADKNNFKENIGGEFIVHKWEKEGKPVFEKEYAWEGIGPNYVNVFKKENGYLMFYGTYAPEGVNKNNYPLGIAWSDDGLHWKRHPKSLDEDGFKYQTLDRRYLPDNPTGFDYLGIGIFRKSEELPFRIDFYRSEDGLDWEKFKPEERTWWYGPSDVIDFFYDDSRKKFYLYHKIWKVEGTQLNGEKYNGYFPAFRPHFDRENGTVRIVGKELFTDNGDVEITLECAGKGDEDGGGGTVTKNMRMLRVIGIVESEDFLTWTNHKVILEPTFENYTAQFYGSPVLDYHGLHLCFVRYLAGDTGEMHVLFGVSNLDKIELLSEEPVLSCGKNDEWDSGLIGGSVPVEINGRLCMYYNGRRTSHTAKNTPQIVLALGRAWLRKDGFVSFSGGTLITNSFPVTGTELRVNASGSISAKLLDAAGKEIANGTFSGDATDEKILEVNSANIENGIIEFDCQHGSLFSFWFQ